MVLVLHVAQHSLSVLVTNGFLSMEHVNHATHLMSLAKIRDLVVVVKSTKLTAYLLRFYLKIIHAMYVNLT